MQELDGDPPLPQALAHLLAACFGHTARSYSRKSSSSAALRLQISLPYVVFVQVTQTHEWGDSGTDDPLTRVSSQQFAAIFHFNRHSVNIALKSWLISTSTAVIGNVGK